MKLLSSIPRSCVAAKLVVISSLAGPAGVVGMLAGTPGQTGFVTGLLPAPLPDIGAFLLFGQSLHPSDLDDNIILSISPLQ
jgi:hypothetical protein